MRGLINGIYIGVPWPADDNLTELIKYSWLSACNLLSSNVAEFKKKNASDECETVIKFTSHASFDPNNCNRLILDEYEL